MDTIFYNVTLFWYYFILKVFIVNIFYCITLILCAWVFMIFGAHNKKLLNFMRNKLSGISNKIHQIDSIPHNYTVEHLLNFSSSNDVQLEEYLNTLSQRTYSIKKITSLLKGTTIRILITKIIDWMSTIILLILTCTLLHLIYNNSSLSPLIAEFVAVLLVGTSSFTCFNYTKNIKDLLDIESVIDVYIAQYPTNMSQKSEENI